MTVPMIASVANPTAAAEATFAAPRPQPVDALPGLGSLMEVVLALLVVLALIMAVAWFARRLRVSGRSATGIRVIAETAIGVKERAVLLEVHGRQLLVGVAAGSVTTLHVFDVQEVAAVPAGTVGSDGTAGDGRPSFPSLLRRSLGLR